MKEKMVKLFIMQVENCNYAVISGEEDLKERIKLDGMKEMLEEIGIDVNISESSIIYEVVFVDGVRYDRIPRDYRMVVSR